MRSRRLSDLRCSRRSRAGAGPLHLAALLAIVLAPAAPASLTGVCPDGSVYIVQSEQAIPCSDSKQVEPHEVPPLRPEYLPRPYTWEVYQEGADPNNPYNLIDAAEKVRGLNASDDGSAPAQAPEAGLAPPLPGGAAASGAAGPLDLGLSATELRDLHQLVELSQQAAPAAFVQETADGAERLRIGLAHSHAFEARLRDAGRARGVPARGPVLVFTALARQPATFDSHFTFVQDHLAFAPESHDPAQLGVVQGHPGELDPGEVVLGYVVLPQAMDLARPVDVYWHDRRLSVTFRP